MPTRPINAEWGTLRTLKRPYPVKGLGAWGEASVMEADQVRAKARQEGKTVHFGRICEFCHEKGSELEHGDPAKNMTGRAVLLGDNVKDPDFNWAELRELGSSPPSIEAAIHYLGTS